MGNTIPVTDNCRDLRAHLNSSSARMVGSTLIQRLVKGAKSARILRYAKALSDKKQMIMEAKIVAGALYGCETTPINDQAQSRFRAAVVDALEKTTARRSLDLVFATTAGNDDLDPETEVLKRSVKGLRRMVARERSMKKLVDDIYRTYHEQGEPAIGSKGKEPDDNEPTIQPMTRTRAEETKEV